jgi:hypothetical protein
MYETEIIDTVYRMISKANTTQEKRRLAGQLDKVISRLEALV